MVGSIISEAVSESDGESVSEIRSAIVSALVPGEPGVRGTFVNGKTQITRVCAEGALQTSAQSAI